MPWFRILRYNLNKWFLMRRVFSKASRVLVASIAWKQSNWKNRLPLVMISAKNTRIYSKVLDASVKRTIIKETCDRNSLQLSTKKIRAFKTDLHQGFNQHKSYIHCWPPSTLNHIHTTNKRTNVWDSNRLSPNHQRTINFSIFTKNKSQLRALSWLGWNQSWD